MAATKDSPDTLTRRQARRQLEAARGRGVLVAVVDSGWSRAVPDPRVLPATSVFGEEAVDDLVGHGTYCGLRVLQVAPEARILPIKVFATKLETSVNHLCEGIRIAWESGANVVNLSLATELAEAIRPLWEICKRARNSGVVIVAAAHNQKRPAVPADLEPVLSVDQGSQTGLLDFSYNPAGPVECTAAGTNAPITTATGWTMRRTGTSIAAATMSGIVARLTENGARDLDAVRRQLRSAANLPRASE